MGTVEVDTWGKADDIKVMLWVKMTEGHFACVGSWVPRTASADLSSSSLRWARALLQLRELWWVWWKEEPVSPPKSHRIS